MGEHARQMRTDAAAEDIRLVVFSDDWGRHPSSCQHLVGHLLDRYRALWVNTIGTRAPKLSWEDVGKAAAKLRAWFAASGGPAAELPANLSVISPRMYPGFRTRWQRAVNARLISGAVNKAMGARRAGERRVAVTTIPITADLPGRLDVDRWVYYCVDDFSVWPGLDGSVMEDMERRLVGAVDACLAVSDTLMTRLRGFGAEPVLLTHGLDLSHWGFEAGAAGEGVSASGNGPTSKTVSSNDVAAASAVDAEALPAWWGKVDEPVLLFWGVVDQRLDVDWCIALAEGCGGLALVGPQQSPDARLLRHERIVMPGPAPYHQLPAMARAAGALVMPYADLPVTRAIQPLKFKEYMATGKPVIVRDLPATRPWSDAADVLDEVGSLVEVTRLRLGEGVPASQRAARVRLADESWSAKAMRFEQAIRGEPSGDESGA